MNNYKDYYFEKKNIENLKCKFELLKEKGLEENIFKYLQKGIEQALATINNPSSDYNEDAIFNAGKFTEAILDEIYYRLTDSHLGKEESWEESLEKINNACIENNLSTIDEDIAALLHVIYGFRNSRGAHAIEIQESSIYLVIFSLNAAFVVSLWYMKNIKNEHIDFCDVNKDIKRQIYQDAYAMAKADGVIHKNEKDLLSKIQYDLSISDDDVATVINQSNIGKELIQYNIHDGLKLMAKCIGEEFSSGHSDIEIKNIALDLGVTWPRLQSFILEYLNNNKITSMAYQGLIMNPEISQRVNIKIPEDFLNTINMSEENYKQFIQIQEEYLSQNNFSIVLKRNNFLPLVHGVLINQRHLIWSFLEIDEKGEINGGNKIYNYSTPDDPVGQYHIDTFTNWFDHFWKCGNEI